MKKSTIIIIVVFAATCISPITSYAGTVARIFTNDMVLQRNKPAPIWGTASSGQTVSVSFNGQQKSVVARAGKWLVRLDPMAAKSSASTMTVRIDGQTISLRNILIGDVWFAAGQSNMAQQLKDHRQGAAVQTSNQVRFFKFPLLQSPGQNPARWPTWFASANNGNTLDFSAIGYFFAHKLRETKNVPIGIVQSVWGGTPIEAWMTRGSLEGDRRFAPILSRGVDFYDGNTFRLPTRLNGTMIKPLQPLAVAGFIWYQGESNTLNNPNSGNFIYRDLFSTLIAEWRRDFQAPNAPFIFAQLTGIFRSNGGNGTGWASLRESQLVTLAEDNTAMAVTIDTGERYEIHPQGKRTIAERMARSARKLYYGDNITHMGPIPVATTTRGSQVTVTFDQVGSGLSVKGGGALHGFETCTSDANCRAATARIVGNKVEISGGVGKPNFARYGWKNWPEYPQFSGNFINLVNSLGIPASPFRTKHLPEIGNPPPPPPPPEPEKPVDIPGKIEAEDYVNFFDTSSGNSGNVYRFDDVDIEATTDAGGGYNVGWVDANEWLEFDINVTEAGNYRADARVASLPGNGMFSVEVDGVAQGNAVRVDATGGWQSWVSQSTSLGQLSPGEKTLRVQVQAGQFNLNRIDIVRSGAGGSSSSSSSSSNSSSSSSTSSSSSSGGSSCDLPYSNTGVSIADETRTWSTGAIDISCAASVNLSLSASGTGPMENADNLNIFYKLNGGSQVSISRNTNAFAEKTVSANNLSGNALEIIVQGTTSYADETYRVANISVSADSGGSSSGGSSSSSSGGGDQCNTTQECKNQFGNRATDCADSQSSTSICMCGSVPCN